MRTTWIQALAFMTIGAYQALALFAYIGVSSGNYFEGQTGRYLFFIANALFLVSAGLVQKEMEEAEEAAKKTGKTSTRSSFVAIKKS